nr:site-specific integrase [Erwinia mallotivora]
MEYSAGHVKAINNVFSKWAENFILDEINKSAILNFKIFLGPDHEHLINVVRRFIVKWNEFNYRGVDSEVISLFKKIHIKKAISGDSVKRKDPSKGPYTKEELEVIIKDIKTLYENKKIKLDCYCFMLLLIYTGRRTNQLTSLRVRDLINDNNCFYLNIPRAKQGGNFRSDFTKISITDCLYRLLYEQAQSIINIAEVFFEKTIAEKTKNELPLFIYKTGLENCVSEEEIFLKRKSDFLHAKKKTMTKKINNLSLNHNIISPRTNEIIKINPVRFRYTIGSELANNGAPIYAIAKALDHTYLKSSGIYIKNHPGNVVEINKRLADFFTPLSKLFMGEEDSSQNFKEKVKDIFDVHETMEQENHCENCRFLNPWERMNA